MDWKMPLHRIYQNCRKWQFQIWPLCMSLIVIRTGPTLLTRAGTEPFKKLWKFREMLITIGSISCTDIYMCFFCLLKKFLCLDLDLDKMNLLSKSAFNHSSFHETENSQKCSNWISNNYIFFTKSALNHSNNYLKLLLHSSESPWIMPP